MRRAAVRTVRKAMAKIADFKKPQQRRFAGGDKPFPMNPFFKPIAPLSDQTRQTIYSLYLDEPEKWTPKQLADHFGLSIARVEAILRLKALQDHLKANGKPAQTDLAKGMDHLLGSLTLKFDENKPLPRREPLRETLVSGMHPFIQLLDEEEKFTPKDAAALLKAEPFENITKRLDRRAQQVFEVEPHDDVPDVLDTNPLLGGKNDFVIVDISSKDESVMVRSKDGAMRPASRRELWKLKANKPIKHQM